MAKRVAVIDIGSNSVRMVVYEKTSRYAFHQLHEEKSKVRISENAYKDNGNLQEIPMQRAFNALADFIKISESFNARKLLCVATSALRDAPNQQDFLREVKKKLKLNIKIISGEKEAYFGAIACANLLPKQSNAMSIDIGGGSTEISAIDKDSVSNTISLKLGTVRLKELYFDNDDIDGAIEYIDAQLSLISDFDISTLIGIGGTFRAISSAILQSQNYPLDKIHAYEYSLETFSEYIEKILDTKSSNELSALGIKNNRLDVIKPGTLILQRVIKKFNIHKVITSGVGVREGVYLSDLLRNSKHKFPHNYNTSIKYLIDSHVQDKAFSILLNSLSKKLFDLTKETLSLDESYRYELGIAAKLYPTGSNIHFYSQNKHTYYLIQSALEYGFTHKNITLIATLTKYAKNRLPTTSHLQKYAQLLPAEHITKALSYLLSLSIALLSHRPRNIDFQMKIEDGTIIIDSKDKLYIAEDAVKKLECSHETLRVVFNS
ncbi:Ppx/GppA family phosphatase [Sulfurimonas aquatica]|uniref:Ppx/GppA family phosphatase n=1 Tax=Sulfurimonas aquatica TaxID=2672570 RepID=A0A975AZA5_9BACT|nr:Ppx/GppA phosphatase family protein [Sulfurimonas aquatica]QSZ41278.1 Ppx/GppA family phosphatase [Sulfurimonas aquatica]